MRVLLFTVFLLAGAGALAQIPRDTATDDQLDPLLAGRDWNGLETILTRPAGRATATKHLHWLNRQVRNGGNFFLAQLYADRLWAASQPQPAQEMLLYAMALVQVDGAICADRTAPERTLRRLMTWQAPTLRAVREQPAVRKDQLVRAVQVLERATAPRRIVRDDSLCGGGEDAILAGMAASAMIGVEVITLPGSGAQPKAMKKQVITQPRGWKPSYLPQNVTAARQAAIRRALQNTLLAIVK